MNERRTGLPITEFKPGQIITRLERAPFVSKEYNENLGCVLEVVKHEDGSYLGEPVEFIGVENNQIYIKHLRGIFRDRTTNLDLDQWENGWGIFVDIAGILK